MVERTKGVDIGSVGVTRRRVLLSAVALVTAPACGAAVVTPLVGPEAADLAFVREEEKLARDVYRELAAIGGEPFETIAESEETHMARVAELLEAHGVPDPTSGLGHGRFRDPSLGALYRDLVTAGKRDRASALAVGLEIEELDLHDLGAVQARSSQSDVRAALDELVRGSRNHLRAFYAQLSAAGGTYEAKHIEQALFMAIATSERETGRGGEGTWR